MAYLKIESEEFVKVRGAKGIAERFANIIEFQKPGLGTKLPALRTTAKLLGVSPTTIALAYDELERRGLVAGHGRGGTVVVRRPGDLGLARVFHMGPTENGSQAFDLSTGFPDPLLLYDYSNATSAVLSGTPTRSFLNRTVSPDLAPILSQLLNASQEELTVVNGSLDGLDRVLEQVCSPGDRVIVEEPNYPPIFDLLDVHRLVGVPVRLDDQGIEVASLAEALRQHPVAMIWQPRAQNPTGVTTSASRMTQLRQVLNDAVGCVIIEDDHSGLISAGPRMSFRGNVDAPTVTIFGFSKSHGPDLRISALAGPKDLIARVVARRRLGPSWTSEITQRILANLLCDPTSIAAVSEAKEQYQLRLASFVKSIDQAGGQIHSRDGLNAWVPVSSELGAITDLARVGVVVAPGSAFCISAQSQEFIRVTTATLDPEFASFIKALSRWL